LEKTKISLDQTVNLLRASGEPTRLRLLVLLANGDLTVSDMTEILGQSQPRISRHLKLLSEAGLLERYQEGAWAYFRLVDQGVGSGIIHTLIDQMNLDDQQLMGDLERLESVRSRRAKQAAEYFSSNADDWDAIRSLHVDEALVEDTMRTLVGDDKIDTMLDLGTGTGRILELFSDIYEKGTGIDASRDMLSVARTRLDDANLSRVQTRLGDLYILPTPANSIDLITIHQVLHFLEEPGQAIKEAAKALADGGRMLIVDFAPHELNFLRDEHAHMRLGFDNAQIQEWLEVANLKLKKVEQLKSKSDQKGQASKLTVSLWLAEKVAA